VEETSKAGSWPVGAEASVGDASPLTPTKRLRLFSGRSHPQLAKAIAAALGTELGGIQLETFADGDLYCRYTESVRGADVFLVQTAVAPVDAHLIELIMMIDAARLASAKRITAVIPRFFYARQDRKSAPREPITARMVADMIENAGADRVLTMDLHAGQVQGFFDIPVDHMTALPMFAERFREIAAGRDTVVVAPATTRAKQGSWLAEMLRAELAIMNDDPGSNGRGMTILGDVEGKIALVLENGIGSGQWFARAAEELAERGAASVYSCATHAASTVGAAERLARSPLDRILVTDTVPIHESLESSRLEVLSVAGLLAETIANVFANESVSAIFVGENQLF
jgi:ribose-phosphate pyrophosphokinase